jgi:hypothetical protein
VILNSHQISSAALPVSPVSRFSNVGERDKWVLPKDFAAPKRAVAHLVQYAVRQPSAPREHEEVLGHRCCRHIRYATMSIAPPQNQSPPNWLRQRLFPLSQALPEPHRLRVESSCGCVLLLGFSQPPSTGVALHPHPLFRNCCSVNIVFLPPAS